MTTPKALQACEDAIHRRWRMPFSTDWKAVALELYRTRFKTINENIALKARVQELERVTAHIRDAAAS